MMILGATMKSLLTVAVMLGLLGGCAPYNYDEAWAPYKKQYDESLAMWLGTKESQLVDYWGTPDRVYRLDGSKYIMYRLPSYRLCEQTFKITNGIVEKYSYNVKGCYSPKRI
jgi:hypothetical protein